MDLEVGVEALGEEPDVAETARHVRNRLRNLRRTNQNKLAGFLVTWSKSFVVAITSSEDSMVPRNLAGSMKGEM